MTLNKLAVMMTGLFVIEGLFFAILLRRNDQVRDEVERLRNEIKLAA
jgi:preprotein translocase subunit SecG